MVETEALTPSWLRVNYTREPEPNLLLFSIQLRQMIIKVLKVLLLYNVCTLYSVQPYACNVKGQILY